MRVFAPLVLSTMITGCASIEPTDFAQVTPKGPRGLYLIQLGQKQGFDLEERFSGSLDQKATQYARELLNYRGTCAGDVKLTSLVTRDRQNYLNFIVECVDKQTTKAPNSRFVSDKFRMALRSTHFAPQPGR